MSARFFADRSFVYQQKAADSSGNWVSAKKTIASVIKTSPSLLKFHYENLKVGGKFWTIRLLSHVLKTLDVCPKVRNTLLQRFWPYFWKRLFRQRTSKIPIVLVVMSKTLCKADADEIQYLSDSLEFGHFIFALGKDLPRDEACWKLLECHFVDHLCELISKCPKILSSFVIRKNNLEEGDLALQEAKQRSPINVGEWNLSSFGRNRIPDGGTGWAEKPISQTSKYDSHKEIDSISYFLSENGPKLS